MTGNYHDPSWRRPLIVFLVAALIGCSRRAASASAPPAQASPPRAYVLHLPGIGGLLRIDRSMLAGLKNSGLDAQIDKYDWTAGDPGLDALLAYDRNRRQAKIVAEMLTKKFHADPRTPIYLTSHSGGAGLLVWALEKCPDDVKVQTVLFLAPALSPGYDLSKALSHVKHHAYVFYSKHDPVLGAATRTLGTIDRVKSDAAGLLGFITPRADPRQYAKLVQMPYKDDYANWGNLGDHIGPMTSAFAEHVLAPLLGAGRKTVQAARPTTQPAGAGL